MQNITSRNRLVNFQAIITLSSPHAATIDCAREYLSAYTPAASAPIRAPNSRTAAVDVG